MTAIIYFFTDNKKKFTVLSDRQVTYNSELREKDKFFKRGRFFIFCAGSEDVYNQIILDINSNRTNLTRLANFINKKCNSIITEYRKPIYGSIDSCSFIIIDTETLNSLIINRGTISNASDFGIVGIGESYTQEIYDIFSDLAPTGFQLKSMKWDKRLFYQKFIEAYHILSHKQPMIGHPALFGLDIFVFQKRKHKHEKMKFKHQLNNEVSYECEVLR